MLRQRTPRSRNTLPQDKDETALASEQSGSGSDKSVKEAGEVAPSPRRGRRKGGSGSTVTHVQTTIQSPPSHHESPISKVYIGLILLLVVPLVAYLGFRCMSTIFGAIHSQKPYTDLMSFATREAQEKRLDNVEDLPVDNLNIFAQSVCMAGDSPERVRNGLRLQLSAVPSNVADDLVNRAVIDMMSTASSTQDSKASITETGMVHSYMAFWSTAYNGETSSIAERYTTCVMVSGINLSIAEELAEMETKEENRVIGSRPCECGYVRCARCPVIEKTVTKTPIFKRHALTIKQQIQLHYWMVKQATDQAIALVGNRKNIVHRLTETVNEPGDELKSIRWKGPDENTFLGKD